MFQASVSTNTPRIVFVTLSLDVGGTEKQLALVSTALVRRGWPVSIYCFNRPGTFGAKLRNAGVDIIGPPIEARGRRTPNTLRAALSGIASIRLLSLIRRLKPEIVHFFLTEPYLFGAPVAILGRVPILIMSRRETNAQHGRLQRMRRFEAHLHRHMSVVLGNSCRVVEELANEGCREDRLGLIYNGVDPAAYDGEVDRDEVRRSLGIADDEIAAVMVANLIAYKGHSDLLKATRQLAGNGRRKVKLLLVGRDDGCQASLEREAAELGVADRVCFLGQRDDIPRILRAADLGVHASLTEGFANAILESMTARLPMVVTDVGGNSEAVIDGEQGFVVPAHAPEALADALVRLADDKALRARFGAAARTRIEQNFTMSTCVDRYEALYRGLLAGKVPAEIKEIAIDPLGVKGNRHHPAEEGGSVGVISSCDLRVRRVVAFVYLGTSLAFGRFVLELAEATRGIQDWEFEFIVADQTELSDRLRHGRFRTSTVLTFKRASFLQIVTRFLGARQRFLDRLEVIRPQAVVTLMPHIWSPLLARDIKRRGFRYGTVIHDVAPHPGDPTAIITKWLLRDARHADAIITLSRNTADQLVLGRHSSYDRIVRLFHPDLHSGASLANRTLEPGRPFRILLFGRLLAYKGLSLLLDAVDLLQQDGIPVKLGVAGAGQINDALDRLDAVGAEVINRWLPDSEVASLLARYDAMACCHIEASQSGVAALAFGNCMPVVGTPVGGIAEQVVSGKTGVLANNVTARAFADAVHELIAQPGLYESISRNLTETYQDRSMDRFLGELVAAVVPLGCKLQGHDVR